MRAVLNVSLPSEEKRNVEKEAKKAKKSISAYILFALKFMRSAISEDEVLKMAKEAESDYKKGKTKELKSLADLM